MGTERFDDEIRRKLMNVPDAANKADDMARIHDYVTTHRPPTGSWPWGRLAVYVAGAGLLLTSLLYNLNQRNANRQLQSSIDSLTAHAPARSPAVTGQNRIDTVYLTVHDAHSKESLATNNSLFQQPNPAEFDKNSLPTSQDVAMSQPLTRAPLPLNGRTNAVGSAVISGQDNQRITAFSGELSSRSISAGTGRQTDTGLPSVPSVIVGRNAKKPSPSGRKLRQARGYRQAIGKLDEVERYARIESPRSRSRQKVLMQTNQPILATIPDVSPATDSPIPDLWTRSIRFNSTVSLLHSRPMDTVWHQPDLQERVMLKPASPAFLTTPAAPGTHRRRFIFSTVSLKKSTYRIGTDFLVSGQQLGGTVVGEVMLTSRWSLQMGLGLLQVSGERFSTDNDYHDRHGTDFNHDYRTGLPPGTPLTNLTQHYTILQVPVTIGYLYPMSKQWGVRVGLGSAIDLLAWQDYHFEAKDKGHNDKQSLPSENQSVIPFNNLNLTIGLERSWKHWLVRVGPVGNWQWHIVQYRPDNLSVGGRLQVFYRFGYK